MSNGLWIALSIVCVVIVYTLAKTVFYARKSEQQWREVDKSKLVPWEDDDE